MNLHALYHRPQSNYCYCYNHKTVHIRFRAAKQDIDQITLIYGDKFAWNKKKSVLMKLVCSDELYDYFAAEVTPEYNRLAYIFELIKGNEKLYFTEWGAAADLDEAEIFQHFFQYPYMHEKAVHVVPEWVKDAVFYQIFPERFYNGDPSINPQKVCDWNSKPAADSFFGGDLRGIIKKIDYLEKLGITAIYLTPIFEAATNHKYDTTNYFKVDPAFGDLDTLKELVSKCHSKGIRVILDAVFNHSGYYFAPFQDVIKRGPQSAYFDWFHIYKWPFDAAHHCYDSFAFATQMPKLNTQNPVVSDNLINAAKYWIEEADIDGWRLDVSDEIDHEFWRAFRKAIKGVKPDAYILGENWLDSLPWLMGDQFDSVMNYPVTKKCIQYFAEDRISANQFRNSINRIQMDHTQQVNEVMFNLLDSHDTARFLTQSGGDKDKLKLAAAFQLTYIGTPCIYYGTEIGMEGGGDPDCRRTMDWNEANWDRELFDYYRKLIAIRRNSEALRKGSFRWISEEDDIIAFERRTDAERVLVLINKQPEGRCFTYDFGCDQLLDMVSDERIELHDKQQAIRLDKHSARVLMCCNNQT